jgi:hypothetical protein
MADIVHSIISWDCCFRNFFHLIFSLDSQAYDLEKVELVFVEQRSRKAADTFNHSSGLKALSDLASRTDYRISLRVVYLDDLESPYHLGKLVNAGLDAARGKFVSVMDGDQLLPRGFLKELDYFMHGHAEKAVVAHRKMARLPLGVDSFRDWKRADIDYTKVLALCPDRYFIPYSRCPINNYGPLLAARKEQWKAIGGYDEGPLWSTAASLLHYDAATRFAIAGWSCTMLPFFSLVHPWHPIGYANKNRNHDDCTGRYLDLQRGLVAYAKDVGCSHWRDRLVRQRELFDQNSQLVEKVVEGEQKEKIVAEADLDKRQTICAALADVRRRQMESLLHIPVNLFRFIRSADSASLYRAFFQKGGRY